ncbi:hypothetical protein KI387_019074, partial [Taxus chinensis]
SADLGAYVQLYVMERRLAPGRPLSGLERTLEYDQTGARSAKPERRAWIVTNTVLYSRIYCAGGLLDRSRVILAVAGAEEESCPRLIEAKPDKA